MSKDLIALPETRSWREIPQQVKRRAMSREGKRRLWLQGARLIGGTITLVAVGWAGWQVAQVWRVDLKAVPASEGRAIGDNLVLSTDGVLDRGWLARTLALPRRATLTDLDLRQLRARLLADGQVATADLLRRFPATLSVRLTERTPLVRIMAETATGERRSLLAARDGVVYHGTGYDPALIESLPWLEGIRLEAEGGGFAPIAGMDAVADLLGRAKLEAEPLYRTWEVVSVARLASDGEIAVRMHGGVLAIFNAQTDYFGQLAKLDFILDAAAQTHPGQTLSGEVDLSLGTQVPTHLVASDPAPPAGTAPADAAAPPSPPVPTFHIQIPPTREF